MDRVPVRVQRRRTKGFRLPPDCVYVGRPSKWGNPFVVGEWHMEDGTPIERWTAETATEAFRQYVETGGFTEDLLEIRGKDLCCWCALEDKRGNRIPCHADVLLDISNMEVDEW